MDCKSYLAAISERHHVRSDYMLAKLLHVSRVSVSQYQTGISVPSPLTCYRIADLLQIDPARVVADLEFEKAMRAGKADQAQVWQDWAERLSGTTAAAVLSLLLAGSPSPSQATSGVNPAPSVYYVNRLARILRRWLAGNRQIGDLAPA
jgi:DNA-binding transcriptional regulator YdaS (Cro superfamily)